MKKKLRALIIGFGSIGKKHHKILKQLKIFEKIYVLSKYKNIKNINYINDSEIKTLNPDYVIVSNNTNEHYVKLKAIDKILRNKVILVEKPLFENYKKYKIKNNKIFVGYNLRFHAMIIYIKNLCKNEKIFLAQACCGSYLPEWRKNSDYKKSYSAFKNKGGGVMLDLSHELDLFFWLFGAFKIKNYTYKKISNLKINSKDYLSLTAINKKNILLDINLNYFSKILKRFIIIEGINFSIYADLINNFLIYKKKNNLKKIFFKNNSFQKSYIAQHRNILLGNYKNACSLADALELLKIIKNIN